ncbi:hypothetical protein [Allomuricauda sp. d1]|uniref:hypothetical protein n=1 Tax=Allomuricauda sp. d1 TaxID=3136725 RepID=UPI0031DAAEC0
MAERVEGKTTAIIAYCTIVGCLIAITMNLEPKHAFARFHMRQAFGIHLIFHAIAFVFSSYDFFLAWQILTLCYLLLLVYGLFLASKNQKIALPILGSYFQKWFTFIS